MEPAKPKPTEEKSAMDWKKKEETLDKRQKTNYVRKTDLYAIYTILVSIIVITALVVAIVVRYG